MDGGGWGRKRSNLSLIFRFSSSNNTHFIINISRVVRNAAAIAFNPRRGINDNHNTTINNNRRIANAAIIHINANKVKKESTLYYFKHSYSGYVLCTVSIHPPAATKINLPTSPVEDEGAAGFRCGSKLPQYYFRLCWAGLVLGGSIYLFIDAISFFLSSIKSRKEKASSSRIHSFVWPSFLSLGEKKEKK